jgi:hypothetical protein
MQRSLCSILVGLLILGCLSISPLSATLLIQGGRDVTSCPYVLITMGEATRSGRAKPVGPTQMPGVHMCIKLGSPLHLTRVLQICVEDAGEESVVLFQDDATHVITPTVPGSCSRFNSRSGILAAS